MAPSMLAREEKSAGWAGGVHEGSFAFPPSGPVRVYDLAVTLAPGDRPEKPQL